jgi:hypothetical protein
VDKDEARAVAVTTLEALRTLTWAELRDRYLDRPETVEVLGASGTSYQVETFAMWDGKRDANLRVIVAIDDGGLRAFKPLTKGFIIAPDGSFVGE